MRIDELKSKGFKIVTNWQDCSKKSIFLFNSNDYKKFKKYKSQAFKIVNLLFVIINLRINYEKNK